jgi:hypothetical protein
MTSPPPSPWLQDVASRPDADFFVLEPRADVFVYSVDFEEVVEDYEEHGDAAEEEGEAVEPVVRYHRERGLW